MPLKIRLLNLGSDSAERDITVGLSEYFYQNSNLPKFFNSDKTILVGSRGSGKAPFLNIWQRQKPAKVIW